MQNLDKIKRSPAVASNHKLWPAAVGEAPRLGGKFGGMKHHGKGEPTTRIMRDAEVTA